MDKRNLGIFLGLLVAGTLAATSAALAATATSPITGSMGPVAHGCLAELTTLVGDGENCLYNGGPSTVADVGAYPYGESTGPLSQITYYSSTDHGPASSNAGAPDPNHPVNAFTTLYKPYNGDGKIRQVMVGNLTVDDRGTATGADDLLSFTILMTDPKGGSIIRQTGNKVEDMYTTMQQVLAPHAVNSATPNASGGFDYVIGSAGFPIRLAFTDASAATTDGFPAGTPNCVGQLFGEMECTASFAPGMLDPLRWAPWTTPNSGVPGLSSLENNYGVKTVGTLTCVDSPGVNCTLNGVHQNMVCIDTGINNDCHDSKVSFAPFVIGPNQAPGNGVTAEMPGWDSLLLKVSTNAAGHVISVQGYDVKEYQVFGVNLACGNDPGSNGFTCNSWISGFFSMAGSPAGKANNDGPILAAASVPVSIDVLANDLNFTNPVTVAIKTPPLKGVAVVTGSPGAQAGIRISYTANAGATGLDSFFYTVTDPANNAVPGKVSIVIGGSGAQANDDEAETTRNAPIAIPVGANDSGFGNAATVTVNNDFSNGGSAAVTAGQGGPPDGIVVTYTPHSNPGTPTYTETFSYTIDDGVAQGTATVSVLVTNTVPVASDGAILLSTQGVAPAGVPGSPPVNGTFTPPGTGGNLGDLSDTGSAFSITSTNGARGTTSVATDPVSKVTTITYTIADATFFYGTDQFTYTITDKDGETATGTVTVTVPNVAPMLAPFWDLNPDQDHDSTATLLSLFATYGNGGREQHVATITAQGTHGACLFVRADGTPEPDGAGALIYRPDPGFVGTDSCQFTLTDADGEQTAPDIVNVTVKPLIVVTPNVGGAAVDPWSLSLLAGLPLLRSRRARAARRPLRAGRTWRTAGSAAAVVAMLGASFAAWGQVPEQPAADAKPQQKSGVAIGEIVVTARKESEKLKDVPLSVTAFDSDTIAAAGITNLTDVAELTPGLSFFNAFGENLPVPVIRGVAPTDIFGQNNAAIFVDGVYVAGREGLNFSQLDVERIEVVKGPQSALYGRTAFSGAINYVSKDPSEEFESKVGGEIGNRGKTKGSLLLSGPLLGEQLRGRVAVLYDDWDGSYNASPSTVDLGGYRYRSYQASLLWKPLDDLVARFSYYKSNDRIDDPATVGFLANCEDRIEPPPNIDNTSPAVVNAGKPTILPTPGVRLQNFCGEIPGIRSAPGPLNGSDTIPHLATATGEERYLDRAHLKIDWDLHNYGSVSMLTGFSNTKGRSASDFGRNVGTNSPFLFCVTDDTQEPGTPNKCQLSTGVPTAATNVFRAGVLDKEYGTNVDEFSQELRYTSPRNARVRVTGGGYWYKSTLENHNGGIILTNQPQLNADGRFVTGCTPTGCIQAPGTPDGSLIGMPPYDPSVPNFAIGTAIFYGTLTPDGGIDPFHRVSQKEDTQGWAVFSGLDFDITERLTAHGELRLNDEAQTVKALQYTPCKDKVATDVTICGDDYYDLRYAAPIFLDAGGNCTGLDGVTNAIGRCSVQTTVRFQMITGRVGLDFKVTDDWMAYGSIAYGEKPGGARLIQSTVLCPGAGTPPAGCPSADGTIPSVSKNPFDTETIMAYELGLKGVTANRRFGIDAAVFYNDWRKIVLRQLLDQDPDSGLFFSSPTAFNVNAGNASVYGAEVSADVGIMEGLKGNLTFGWTSAKLDNARMDTYARFVTFRAPGCDAASAPPDDTNGQLRDWWNNCNKASGNVSGNELLRQPEWKGSVSLAYTHQLMDDWTWSLRGDASYQSSVYVGNDNESWLPPHTYVNMKLGVRSPIYTAEFWVRNLFDDGNAIAAFRDIYWSNTSNIYAANPAQGPRPNFDSFVPYRYSVTYPRERTFGITLEARFGAAAK